LGREKKEKKAARRARSELEGFDGRLASARDDKWEWDSQRKQRRQRQREERDRPVDNARQSL
jgi:hypothetical protein